jgi:DNA-binding IclR family transcriptional regulator
MRGLAVVAVRESVLSVEPARGTKPTRTIERAALVLTCFSVEEPHLTLAALSAKLGLNQSTVYRYVQTLLAAGLLERDETRSGYRLGLRVVELAYVTLNQLTIRKEALDEMDRLRDEFRLLVNLGVLFQGDVLMVAHSTPEDFPRWKTMPGRRVVAHCTAVGKVLIAHLPWEEVRGRIEERGWRPYTARSVRDFDRLEAELAFVREHEYAVEREECVPGGACLALPIRNRSGAVIAGLSLTGAVARYTPEFEGEILDRARGATIRISARLGYDGVIPYF